ncbi:MAG: hypothetical protein ACYC91_04375 [Solirubrobacteraceae bacterium]
MPRLLAAHLGDDSRGRRLGAGAAIVAALALVFGIVLGAGLPGSSAGAGAAARSSSSSTVARRDLVATDTEPGTLSHADPHTVFNRMSGTITSLPVVGQVVKPGQALYQVDGSPVILLDGATPAFRALSSSLTPGADVLELNANLVKLGFDPQHQISVENTWQPATTTAVEAWQASLGESQTGTITLGQVVFLPGAQRISSISTVLGSTGGSGASAGSATATGASTAPAPARSEFVSLSTTTAAASDPGARPELSTRSAVAGDGSRSTSAQAAACPTPMSAGQAAVAPMPTAPSGSAVEPGADAGQSGSRNSCPPSAGTRSGGSSRPGAGRTSTPGSKASTAAQTLAALIAVLKAQTLLLARSRASTGTASGAVTRSPGGPASSGGSSRTGGGTGGAGAALSSGSGGGASGAASAASGGSVAQAIMQTTSTQLVVTVELDATKQSEAVVGEPVTVQLPNGNTVNGRITQVSPVAQSASSSSSSGGGSNAAGGSSSSTPTATVPVSITLNGHRSSAGLDQAAVSVNFQQQVADHVLSVPVTALLATAGGGYAVQEAVAPHRLLTVTPGLFAAGYVQVAGRDIYPGLQVTDSQG